MRRLAAHGISIELPPRWSGRVFRGAGGGAVLHAADLPLVLGDGEFGDASTASMPAGSSFIALVEYVPGAGLKPGEGLFASRRLPSRLDPSRFSVKGLAHPRPGQAGMQHFCTLQGRPFCLYLVVASSGPQRRRRLAVLDHILSSVGIS